MFSNLKDKACFYGAIWCNDLSDWFYDKVSLEYVEAKAAELHDQMDAIQRPTIIYGVIEGPIHRDSIPDDEGVPDDMLWMMVVKTQGEEPKTLEDVTLWFRNLDDAYAIQKHFYTSVEPMRVYL